MSIPKIQELHASFIWTESAPALPGTGAPLALLGDRQAFAGLVDELKERNSWWPLEAARLGPEDQAALAALFGSPDMDAGKLDTLHWALPWEAGRQTYRHNFWHHYLGLGANSLQYVTGDAAWEHLTPLRLRVRLQAANPPPSGGPALFIGADGYAYPHGSAVEIKLRLVYEETGILAHYALGHLRGLRNNPIAVRLPGGNPQAVKLQALAQRLLGFVRGLVWGKTAAAGFKMADDPLWIVTPVKGWTTDPAAPLVAGTPLHQILDGFCTLAPNWSSVQPVDLAPLNTANLLIGSSSGQHIGRKDAGHILYHRPRSRLVWMPAYFTSTEPHFHKLSCYHRNLMLASLQTEMLARALFLYDSSPVKTEALTDLASAAARRISELYGSIEEATYVSAGPRAYMDEMSYTGDTRYVQKINQVLGELGLPPLAWTPWRAAAAGD